MLPHKSKEDIQICMNLLQSISNGNNKSNSPSNSLNQINLPHSSQTHFFNSILSNDLNDPNFNIST